MAGKFGFLLVGSYYHYMTMGKMALGWVQDLEWNLSQGLAMPPSLQLAR